MVLGWLLQFVHVVVYVPRGDEPQGVGNLKGCGLHPSRPCSTTCTNWSSQPRTMKLTPVIFRNARTDCGHFHFSLAIGLAGWRRAWVLICQPKSSEAFSVELKAGTYRYEVVGRGENCDRRRRRIESSGKEQQFKAPFDGRRGVLLEGGMRALLAKSQRLACPHFDLTGVALFGAGECLR